MEDLTGQVDTVDSITALEWNNFQTEWKNFIEAFVSMNVSDLTQMQKSASAVSMQGQWTTASGGSIAYILAMNTGILAPHGYATGQVFQFRPNANNTVGAVSVNVGALGVKLVVREDGSALQAADLSTTRDAVIRYDGTDFRLMNFTLAADATDLPDGFISGLTAGRNDFEAAGTYADIRIKPGQCRDATNSGNLVQGTSWVKSWDVAFAFGNGGGGWPGATSRAVGTWYRFFMVGRNINGTVDFGFDTAANDDAADVLTAANALEGDASWDRYRQLGWVRTTDGDATELVPFSNELSDPTFFRWTGAGAAEDPAGGIIGAGTGVRQTYTTSFAPPETTAEMRWYGFQKENTSGAVSIAGIIGPIDHPDEAPTQQNYHLYNPSPGPAAGAAATPTNIVTQGFLGACSVHIDEVQQYHARWRAGGANGWPFVIVDGFRFER